MLRNCERNYRVVYYNAYSYSLYYKATVRKNLTVLLGRGAPQARRGEAGRHGAAADLLQTLSNGVAPPPPPPARCPLRTDAQRAVAVAGRPAVRNLIVTSRDQYLKKGKS